MESKHLESDIIQKSRPYQFVDKEFHIAQLRVLKVRHEKERRSYTRTRTSLTFTPMAERTPRSPCSTL